MTPVSLHDAGHGTFLSQTELATIWLAAWAIREPGMLDPAASRGLAASLPLGSQQMTDAMVSYLSARHFWADVHPWCRAEPKASADV